MNFQHPPPMISDGGSFVFALCVRGPVPRSCGDRLLDSRCLRLTRTSAAEFFLMYTIIFPPPTRCVFSQPVFGLQPPVVFRDVVLKCVSMYMGCISMSPYIYIDRNISIAAIYPLPCPTKAHLSLFFPGFRPPLFCGGIPVKYRGCARLKKRRHACY